MQNTFHRFSLIMFITLFFVACATAPEAISEPEPTEEPQAAVQEEPEATPQEPEADVELVVEAEPEPAPEPVVEPVDPQTAVRAEVEELVRRLDAYEDVTVTVVSGGVDIVITSAFAPNDAAVAGALPTYLDLIGEVLTLVEVDSIAIEGHVADVGDPANHGPISRGRAVNTAAHLADNFDIPRSAMTTVGRGASSPIATNATTAGRTRNRRVALLIRVRMQ